MANGETMDYGPLAVQVRYLLPLYGVIVYCDFLYNCSSDVHGLPVKALVGFNAEQRGILGILQQV